MAQRASFYTISLPSSIAVFVFFLYASEYSEDAENSRKMPLGLSVLTAGPTTLPRRARYAINSRYCFGAAVDFEFIKRLCCSRLAGVPWGMVGVYNLVGSDAGGEIYIFFSTPACEANHSDRNSFTR